MGWVQDELQRFHEHRVKKAKEAGSPAPEAFTLYDFRRTAITGMQMAGVSEKEASVMVGGTPEVIRKHYEKMDRQAIARCRDQKRLGAGGASALQIQKPQPLRAVGRGLLTRNLTRPKIGRKSFRRKYKREWRNWQTPGLRIQWGNPSGFKSRLSHLP